MPGKSYLAWGSRRMILIIKGLRSVQEQKPHVTCFGTQKYIYMRFPGSGGRQRMPEQKCATSSLFHEGPIQLVRREKDQLVSLTFQLSVRPSNRVAFLEGVRDIRSGCLISIFPRGRQPSINSFYFPHWQEMLVLLLEVRSGCRLSQRVLGTMLRWAVGRISSSRRISANSGRWEFWPWDIWAGPWSLQFSRIVETVIMPGFSSFYGEELQVLCCFSWLLPTDESLWLLPLSPNAPLSLCGCWRLPRALWAFCEYCVRVLPFISVRPVPINTRERCLTFSMFVCYQFQCPLP